MPVDLHARRIRLAALTVGVSLVIAIVWEMLPPYGVGPPFRLPEAIVLCADLVALLALVATGVALVAALFGWIVDLDRSAQRRWQGVTVMTLDFYLARYDHYLFGPELEEDERERVLDALQSIRARGDTAIFVLSDAEGYADRVIVMTRAAPATVRDWGQAMPAGLVSRASRGDRSQLMRRYPNLAGAAWWISWGAAPNLAERPRPGSVRPS